MADMIIDEDDFRAAVRLVRQWRATPAAFEEDEDEFDRNLVDLIAQAIGRERRRSLAAAPPPEVIDSLGGVRFDWVPGVGWRRSALEGRRR
jgi:hypothetical protein